MRLSAFPSFTHTPERRSTIKFELENGCMMEIVFDVGLSFVGRNLHTFVHFYFNFDIVVIVR